MLPTIEFDFDNKLPYIFLPVEKVSPNEKWIKHIHCDGARFHVLSWYLLFDGTVKTKCSDADCIYNKE